MSLELSTVCSIARLRRTPESPSVYAASCCAGLFGNIRQRPYICMCRCLQAELIQEAQRSDRIISGKRRKTLCECLSVGSGLERFAGAPLAPSSSTGAAAPQSHKSHA